MEWPALSLSPSRLIDTPAAWPVITTWKDSNSFFAAAIFAAAVAPAGGCTLGRIFSAAGATQTWAADAEPAASKATSRGTGACKLARAPGEGAATSGPSTSARAHCALPGDVPQRTLQGVVRAVRR